jgi:hypothetical protein
MRWWHNFAVRDRTGAAVVVDAFGTGSVTIATSATASFTIAISAAATSRTDPVFDSPEPVFEKPAICDRAADAARSVGRDSLFQASVALEGPRNDTTAG